MLARCPTGKREGGRPSLPPSLLTRCIFGSSMTLATRERWSAFASTAGSDDNRAQDPHGESARSGGPQPADDRTRTLKSTTGDAETNGVGQALTRAAPRAASGSRANRSSREVRLRVAALAQAAQKCHTLLGHRCTPPVLARPKHIVHSVAFSFKPPPAFPPRPGALPPVQADPLSRRPRFGVDI